MSISIQTSLGEAPWREFIARTRLANIFHTPEMFEVFARTSGHRPEVWAAVDGNDVLALLTPVHLTLLSGPLARWTTRSVGYGGAAMVEDARAAGALRDLLRSYSATAAGQSLFTELRNVSDLSSFMTVHESVGFHYEPHLNFLIPLDMPADQVLEGIGRRTRRHIRRALRSGDVEVREVEERHDLAVWYDTLRQTYAHARVPLADRSLFEAAFELLRPAGMIKLLLAWVGATPAACSAELLYGDRIYAWYAGTDRRFSAQVPNEVLMWTILEWGATHGYRVYDFGGAGKPDQPYGVRDFKAKFGGELVEYGRYVSIHSPARLAISAQGYRAYQHLRGVRDRLAPRRWPPARAERG